jgi:stage III sporulation protein AA
VDERGELFPDSTQFDPGPRTDVLFGCDKPTGIEMVLKTMGPGCIAVDEVTSERDCAALMQAGWCGVRLLATAHAASVADLKGKQIYRELIKTGLFEFVFVMQKDKSWNMERL